MSDEKNIWDYIVSKNDIVSIIGEYVSLTKQGKNYKACCPFHGEKTPSFIVSQDKGIFKCFGCGKSGNVIKFIELKENINSIEALKFLANKQNLDLNQFSHFFDKNKVSNEQLRILEINNEANNFFRYQLLFEKTEQLKNYLKSRGIDDSLIKEFQIGFASNQKSIFNSLIEKQFNLFEISNSSLVTGQNNKNFFNDRLMFPIHNSNGDVVAFSGRDITNNQIPKYLNSSETIVFKKNDVIFNYYHAKDEILKNKEVYLVEGQFDCIALFKAGIKNTVALMGTTLSSKHLEQFKNKTITFFLDNDNAGRKATFKNLKTILSQNQNLNISINFIEHNLMKDPDEIYQIDQGKTLKGLCEKKMDVVDYLFNRFNEINQNVKNANIKNFENKKLFEYVNYLEPSLQIMIKEKLLDNNVFSKELYDYFKLSHRSKNYASYIKPYKELSKRSIGLKMAFNKKTLYKPSKDTIKNLNNLNNDYQFLSNVILLGLENPRLGEYFKDKRIKKIITKAQEEANTNKKIDNDFLTKLIDKEFSISKKKYFPFWKIKNNKNISNQNVENKETLKQ